jgi:hypothetical protein
VKGSDAGRGRRRWLVTVVAVLALAAGAVVLVRKEIGGDDSYQRSGNGSATSLATVERRTLSTQTRFNGTLGYAGAYTVLAQAHGTVTWLPKIGRVVRQGQVLYRVDGAPVVLLYGATPAWRPLAEGALATDVTGADVAQLNHDLVALGYVPHAEVSSVWRDFSWATRAGVERLQHHLGVDETGALDLGDVVFLPTAARVTALPTGLGGRAAGPVLSATSTRRTVNVALDASLRAEVTAGDRVTITLPDGSAVTGRVGSVGRVASTSSSGSGASGDSQDSGPTVPVTIRPVRRAATGGLDQALVEVAITDRTVHNVLAVPVNALLARSGGGDAVEVAAGNGTHHLVVVRPGLFDDAAGMVQVSGPGLAAGQRVVVPGND